MYHDDLDRMLTSWMDDPISVPAPPYLGAVLERTRRTRQRPAWASLERWLPMSDKTLARPSSPPMRGARLALVALIVLALAITAAIVGSRLIRQTPAIPQGGAAVFAFSSIVATNAFGGVGGDIYTVQGDGTNLRRLTAVARSTCIRRSRRTAHASLSAPSRTAPGSIWWSSWMPVAVDGRSSPPRTPARWIAALRSGLVTRWDAAAVLDHRVVLERPQPDDRARRRRSPRGEPPPRGHERDARELVPGREQIAFLGTEGGGYTGVYVADVGASGVPAGGVSAPEGRTRFGRGVGRRPERDRDGHPTAPRWRQTAAPTSSPSVRRTAFPSSRQMVRDAPHRRERSTTRNGHLTGGGLRSTARSTDPSSSWTARARFACGS